MIDPDSIKSACTELNKRTGISIELLDQSQNVIVSVMSKGSAKSKDVITITPRSDKRFTIKLFFGDKSSLSDTAVQLISLYLEQYFVSRPIGDILSDMICDNISQDTFLQHLNDAHIDPSLTYRLYLIKCTKEHKDEILEITKEILDPESHDLLFPLNSESLVLIKECDEEISADEALELAHALYQSISLEIACNTMFIAVSGIYNSLIDIKRAYASAANALRIGTACNFGKNIFVSEKLRIEELLDSLPNEVLKNILEMYPIDKISQAWDDRMNETIQSVFDNNLNLSVAARELYTHRNTLVYRLEKIKKLSGFDLRSFDDAVMLKIIMTADKLCSDTKK